MIPLPFRLRRFRLIRSFFLVLLTLVLQTSGTGAALEPNSAAKAIPATTAGAGAAPEAAPDSNAEKPESPEADEIAPRPAPKRSRGKPSGEGDKNPDVVGPGESRHVAAGESIEDLTVAMGKATIDGRVLGDLLVMGGKVTVNGTIDGSVVGAGCRLVLGSNAVVRGDVTGFGKLEKRSGALIQGKQAWRKGVPWRDVINQTPNEWLNNLAPEARIFLTEQVFKGRPLSLTLAWPWAVLLGLIIAHVAALQLFPQSITRTARLVGERPLTTLLLGMVSLPLLLIVGLAVSLVTGCLGAPFFILAVMLGVIVGKVAMELQLGGRLLALGGLSGSGSTSPADSAAREGESVWPAYLLGTALLVGVYLVPYVGVGIWTVVTLWGLGAALMLLFNRSNAVSPGLATAAASPGVISPTVTSLATPASVPVPVATESPAPPQPTTLAEAPLEVLVPAAPRIEFTPENPPTLPATHLLDVTNASGATTAPATRDALIPPAFPTRMDARIPDVSTGPGAPPLPMIPPTGATGPTPLPSGASPLERDLWALPRVGLRLRLLALLVDVLVYGMLEMILPRWFERIPFGMVLVAILYFAGFWVWKGATVGGLLTGIRVIRLDGRRIDWQVAVVRSLASFLSLFSGGLGEFWCAWDLDQQTWQDKLAGTVVVKEDRTRSLV